MISSLCDRAEGFWAAEGVEEGDMISIAGWGETGSDSREVMMLECVVSAI